MKKIIFLFSLIIVFTACKNNENKANDQQEKSSQETKFKRYEIKSGMVEYKITISGNVMGNEISGEGTSSLYFKDWGAKEIREEQITQTTKVSMMGVNSEEKQSSHTMDKLDNGKSYHVDFETKKIYLSKDPLLEFFKESGTDPADAGKKILESMGGKKVGNEKYMGYDCEIWEIMGTKHWIYKGITLKSVTEMMGVSTVMEATSVKFDINVPDSKFELPDFPIVKKDNYMNSEEMKEDMESMKNVKTLSYEEWKEMIADDPEMQGLTDEELKDIYTKMQQMMKVMGTE